MRRNLFGSPSLPAVTRGASETDEGMLIEIWKRGMRGKRLRQTGGKHRAPIVTQMAGDASVDHAHFRVPDLLDTDAETARVVDPVVLLEDQFKALLVGCPFAAVFAPERERHQHKERDRQDHQPGKI